MLRSPAVGWNALRTIELLIAMRAQQAGDPDGEWDVAGHLVGWCRLTLSNPR